MGGRSRSPLWQHTRAHSLEQNVYLELLRSADALLRGAEETLKPAHLSHTQYNVLRILRGAGPDGLACNEIATRMITRDPDITRLLDRLEQRGLISRARTREDRRVIRVRATAKSLALLRKLDAPVRALHRRQLSHMPAARLRALAALLARARSVRASQSPRSGDPCA